MIFEWETGAMETLFEESRAFPQTSEYQTEDNDD